MGIGSHALTLALKRPEAELLLCCARTRMDQAVADRVRRALQQTIDWNYVMQQAAYHGIVPLLHRHLNYDFVADVPKIISDQLRNFSNGITYRNLALTGELLKLLKLFQQQGIRAFPIKGPALAVSAYGNLSLRQFGDLDILVAKEDMLKAKAVVISQGYHPKLNLTVEQEEVYLKSHHDYKCTRPRDGIVVEIQWGITQWSFTFPVDFEELWAHHDEFVLAGEKVCTLLPDDLLPILCVHGAKHCWRQLKWICDIAEILGVYREKIDWQVLLGQARVRGGERMLLLGLFLAHDLVGAELPEETLERMHNDPKVKLLAGQVRRQLFHEASYPTGLREEPPLFYWKSRERLRDKLALLRKYVPEYFFRIVVPNKRDHAVLRLPSFLSTSYYLIRPVRLVWEHWSSILQRFYR